MLSRRRSIFSGVAAAGMAVAGTYIYELNNVSKGERAVAGVIENLTVLPGAVRFGLLYRNQQKDTDSITVKSISDRLHQAYGESFDKHIDEALERQLQIELRKNQLQLVDDWYLTRTEAELCALASILKSET